MGPASTTAPHSQSLETISRVVAVAAVAIAGTIGTRHLTSAASSEARTTPIGADSVAPSANWVRDTGRTVEQEPTRPHLVGPPLSDTVVSVRGSAVCTGTALAGTSDVVTAAHCVLDPDGAVTDAISVLRGGRSYAPRAVLVDLAHHTSPSPRTDAAILVMDQTIPGPSATLGGAFPVGGAVTLVGFQPLASDGSLQRGTGDDTVVPHTVTGGVQHAATAAAGCTVPASAARITDAEVRLPCGLIPGASGGGAFVDDHGQLTLVGIVSTADVRFTTNGLVPLSSVHRLLDNPIQYQHELGAPYSDRTAPPIKRW
jgi:hypothetical protein